MYHFGIRHELLPPSLMNPFTRFGLARVRVRDAKPIFVFDETQELSFLSSSTRWAFAIHFTLAKTGLRPGELCHLLIEDVDLGGGWLKVCGKPELGWSVKTGRDRRVPLISEVVAVLRRVIGSRTEGAVFLREKFDPARPTAVIGGRSLLANVARHRLTRLQAELGRTASRSEEATCLRTVWRDAGAVDLDRVRASFIATASRAALPSAATCPKSWRHTFATLMQQANVDPLVRQETLGHKPATSDASTLGMTSVYTHTPPTFQKSEIERAMSFRPHVLVLAVKFAALNTTGTEVSHVTH
jgi:integrase